MSGEGGFYLFFVLCTHKGWEVVKTTCIFITIIIIKKKKALFYLLCTVTCIPFFGWTVMPANNCSGSCPGSRENL